MAVQGNDKKEKTKTCLFPVLLSKDEDDLVYPNIKFMRASTFGFYVFNLKQKMKVGSLLHEETRKRCFYVPRRNTRQNSLISKETWPCSTTALQKT